jgi:hypothetical protein
MSDDASLPMIQSSVELESTQPGRGQIHSNTDTNIQPRKVTQALSVVRSHFDAAIYNRATDLCSSRVTNGADNPKDLVAHTFPGCADTEIALRRITLDNSRLGLVSLRHPYIWISRNSRAGQ